MKLEVILQKLGLLQTGKIMYIGGSDVLPAPLKPEQERQAVAALEQGDEAAKQTLIEHNLRLVVYIARRFENTGVNLEDLISIGTIGLIKAVNTFRPDRNIKLATYSSRCIENEILMHIRKIANQKTEVSLDDRSIPTGTATNYCCPMYSAQTAILLCGRWRTMLITSFCVRRSDVFQNGRSRLSPCVLDSAAGRRRRRRRLQTSWAFRSHIFPGLKNASCCACAVRFHVRSTAERGLAKQPQM